MQENEEVKIAPEVETTEQVSETPEVVAEVVNDAPVGEVIA